MNYKIGDRVRVREWDDMAKEFGVDEYGNIPASLALYFIKTMSIFCGDIFTISEINDDGYILLGDEYGFTFTDEMLVPVAESVDEKIHYAYCGNWEILECNGFKASGHSISEHDWCDLLRYLGHDVEEKEISDEEMEELC